MRSLVATDQNSSRSTRSSIFARVENGLQPLGVTITQAVPIYLEKILRNSLEDSWLKYARSGKFIDDHIMIGGLSEMTWSFGTLVATPSVALKVRVASTQQGTGRRNTLNAISGMIQRKFMMPQNVTFVAPLVFNNHWGVCIAKSISIEVL